MAPNPAAATFLSSGTLSGIVKLTPLKTLHLIYSDLIGGANAFKMSNLHEFITELVK